MTVLDRLATATSADLSTLATELRTLDSGLAACLDTPMQALNEDIQVLGEERKPSERPQLWIDGLYFDGPLTRQEIDSHIAAIMLSKINTSPDTARENQ